MFEVFPLNYFRTIFSPILAFKNRRHLKIWQITLLVLFLTGVLLLPMSLQLGKLQQAPLVDYTPNAVALIDEDLIVAVNQLERTEVGYEIESLQIIEEESSQVVALVPDTETASSLLEGRTGIVLAPTAFYIQEANKPLINQSYLNDSALETVTTSEELSAELSRQWFEVNRLSIVLTNFINTWILMVTGTFMLLIGSSFFISLMKFTDRFSINSFNEALQLCLNCLGLPTIAATLIGFITGSPTTMLSAQGIGFVIVLIWVYWKTQFQDQHVAKLEAQAAGNQPKALGRRRRNLK